MREWIEKEKFATTEELDTIEKEARAKAKKEKDQAWKAFSADMNHDIKAGVDLIGKAGLASPKREQIEVIAKKISSARNPEKGDLMKAARKALRILKGEKSDEKQNLSSWTKSKQQTYFDQYSSRLYSESVDSALNKETIPAVYSDESDLVDGRRVLNACFDHLLQNDARIFALGEDIGKIGDVNQGFAGLQDKYGDLRVVDTGIRETTIIGQGIGTALRGLKPIAEIQYLDYLLFAIQTLSDDLATLQYRTFAGQKAPLIIRTRGHRLEGVWHSGSPIGMILHSLRGIYVLTPRNMTQAAGFYNTLMASDDPALVIESLNGYRLKERVPDNLSEFRIALGMPEILKEGNDVTIVTYGSTCRIVMDAANQLAQEGIDVEVIDAQTLIPFDRPQMIVGSVKKTNRLVVVDEDVQGGASGYILQQVIERDGGYYHLDSAPLTITGKEHRPAYGSDGDYFSKPNAEDIFEGVYQMMSESFPDRFPDLY